MIIAIVLILVAGITAIVEGPDSNPPPAGVTITAPTEPTFTEPRQAPTFPIEPRPPARTNPSSQQP